MSNQKDPVNSKQQDPKESARYEDVSMLLLWMPNYTTGASPVGTPEHLAGKSLAGAKPTGKDQKI